MNRLLVATEVCLLVGFGAFGVVIAFVTFNICLYFIFNIVGMVSFVLSFKVMNLLSIRWKLCKAAWLGFSTVLASSRVGRTRYAC
jgi:hypothetical protein